jgi:hypothetical protein
MKYHAPRRVDSYSFPVKQVVAHDEDEKLKVAAQVNPLEIELGNWNQLWNDLVGEMSKISPFPAFLVRDSESQRKSLTLLAHDVCRIAANPMETPEYLRLSHHYEQQCEKVKELEDENAILKSELIRLKADRDYEIAHISERIETLELLAAEIQMNKEIRLKFMDRSTEEDHPLGRMQKPTSRATEVAPKANPRPSRSRSVGLPDCDSTTSFHDAHLDSLIQRYQRSPLRSSPETYNSGLSPSLGFQPTPKVNDRRPRTND